MNKLKNNKIAIKNIANFFIVAIFFFLDRFLKHKSLLLPSTKELPIIPKILNFSFAPNPGISFSIPLNNLLASILSALILLTLTIVYLKQKKLLTRPEKLLILFIFLGAISNLIDRILFGFVIDYLNLCCFSIFNIADLMISLSSLSLIFILLRKDFIKK